MIKSVIAGAAVAVAFAAPGAALAGPYVNVEANSSFTGSDYTGTTTDAHISASGEVRCCFLWLKSVLLSSPLMVVSRIPFCLVRFMVVLMLPEALSVYGEVSFSGGVDGADNDLWYEGWCNLVLLIFSQ